MFDNLWKQARQFCVGIALGSALGLAQQIERPFKPLVTTEPPTPRCDPYSMQTLPKLDFRQRACYWRSQIITGPAFSGAAFWGLIGEMRHKPPEWPQGADGFGRQFGTRYAQGVVKSTATFLMAAALQEDPRPLGPMELHCAGRSAKLWPRVGQAVARVFWTQDSNCSGRLALSRLSGSFASGFVSLAWAPPSVNKINSALVGTGTALGGYIGNSLFSEFQGDIFGALGKIVTAGKGRVVKK